MNSMHYVGPFVRPSHDGIWLQLVQQRVHLGAATQASVSTETSPPTSHPAYSNTQSSGKPNAHSRLTLPSLRFCFVGVCLTKAESSKATSSPCRVLATKCQVQAHCTSNPLSVSCPKQHHAPIAASKESKLALPAPGTIRPGSGTE